MKIREYGVSIGDLPIGRRNSITDVKGIKVGHFTLDYENVKTGVTVLLPSEANIYKEKFIAATHVINGFGKSIGLIQVDELGTIETPIVLTNTLSVGTAHEGLVRFMLDNNDDIGDTTGTVNPIICECNDGELNDIRGLHIKPEHVNMAINNSVIDFDQGNVGAGTGMICYGLKGGIGSSSRVIELDGNLYTVGILVLSNFGRLEDFVLNHNPIGIKLQNKLNLEQTVDKGSIISILATDIPLSARQIKRVLKRIQSGIARTGSFVSNGSGEICIGFSTANSINHYEENDIINIKTINENKLDAVFKATVESTEEAILNSMICSKTTIGRDKRQVYSLKDFIEF